MTRPPLTPHDRADARFLGILRLSFAALVAGFIALAWEWL